MSGGGLAGQGIQSVVAGGGVYQAALEILAHVLDQQRLMLIDDAGDLLEEGIEGDLLGEEFEVSEAPLRWGGSGHSRLSAL